MKKLFIDTGAFYAALDRDDRYYAESRNFWSGLPDRYELVTTNYVIEETSTLIRYRLGIKNSIEFVLELEENHSFIVIDITQSIREKAWEIFKKYSDKDFSFTDCTSFAVMKEWRMETVFGFDGHFQQMGFQMLTELPEEK